MTDEQRVQNSEWEASDETYPSAADAANLEDSAAGDDAPQYGVGPFSIREVALGGVWLIAFIVSFFSMNFLRFDSVWTSGIAWVLTIAVPTAAVFLIALRRLSPEGIRRVGSLGIDQFASVAFTVSSVVWLQLVWETVAFAVQTGQWVRTWVIWVELFLMVIAVFLTVFAPFIRPFDEDFRGRREIPAHRNARPIRAISARPVAAPVPAADEAETVAGAPDDDYDAAVPPLADPDVDAAYDDSATSVIEPLTADTSSSADAAASDTGAVVGAPARQQAFWALVPEEREVVDEIGLPMFRIAPTAWALVIEDRGESFVVRHEDGRTGFLHDVSGVTRG